MPKSTYDETKTFDILVAANMTAISFANLMLSAATIILLYVCGWHVLNAAKMDKEINSRTSWQFISGLISGCIAGIVALGSPESAKYLNKYAPEGIVESLDPVALLGSTALASGAVVGGAYLGVGSSKMLRFMARNTSTENGTRALDYDEVPSRVRSTSPAPR